MLDKSIAIIGALLVSLMIALPTQALSKGHSAVNNQSIFVDNLNQTANTTKYNSGSLWNSELFNPSRFTLNIKLTPAEKKEASLVVRSFEAHMRTGALFMHHLLTELKKRNLPVELVALPLLESGYKQRARSHAGAKGPWRFIHATGKSYGLKTSSDYDEFYDFIRSTDASLRYLTHLYNELHHNWDLAIAAYNQGEFTIKRAIRKAKKSGITTYNMNTLKLSNHARLYVRRFHAYADILRSPEKYRVKLPQLQNRPAFKQVQVAGKLNSMKKAAELAGVKVSTLKHLNAGYLTDSLRTKQQYGLLVPIENASKLERALKK